MSGFCTESIKLVARKSHRCDVCHYDIERGTLYKQWSGVYDGHWFRTKVHLPCDKVAQEIGEDNELPSLREYSVEEQLEILHDTGVLEAALTYMLLDFTDTCYEGLTPADIIVKLRREREEWKAARIKRILSYVPRYSISMLSWDDRKIAVSEGLWDSKTQRWTEKAQQLAGGQAC